MKLVTKSGQNRYDGWNVCDKCLTKFFSSPPPNVSFMPPIEPRAVCDFCGGTDEETPAQVRFRELVEYVLGCRPAEVPKADAKFPLFSEAVLYPLVGKDDARSILGRLRRLAEAVGSTSNF